ncbi:O-antigen ligase family protein [Patescibacteria group bacterium]|nr:O-antigen ligase family protein [Patescibacteria group bacterium]
MQKTPLIKILNSIVFFSLSAIVLFVPLFFSFFDSFFDLYILPKQFLFHLFVYIAVVASVAKMLLLEFKHVHISNDIRYLCIITFILIISIFLSSSLSIYSDISYWGSYLREQGLYSYLLYVIFFFLLIFNIKSNKHVNYILFFIAISTTLVSIIGLAEYLGFVRGYFNFRIASTLGQPNFLGHYLVISFPILVYLLRFFRFRYSKSFFSLIIVVQLVALFFTQSRAAWLSFVCLIVVFLLLNLFLNSKFNFKDIFVFNKISLKVIFIALLIIGVVFLSFPLLKSGVKYFSDSSSGSVKVRLISWEAAVQELRKATTSRVLFGFGPDSIANIFAKHYRSENAIYEKVNTYPSRAHNVILDTLLQFGVVGFIAFSLFYYFIVRRTLNILRSSSMSSSYFWLVIALLLSLLANFINNLFSFSLVVTSVYVYLFLALLFVVSSTSNYAAAAPFNQESNMPLSGSIKLAKLIYYGYFKVLVCLIMVCFIFNLFYRNDYKPLIASYYRMQADIALLNNDCSSFLSNTKEAILAHPSRINYKQDLLEYGSKCLFDVEGVSKKEKLARDILITINAIQQANYSFSTQISIAHAYTYLAAYYDDSYYAFAEKEYMKALDFNPNFTLVYRNLAQILMWQGKDQEALVYLNKGLAKLPDINNSKLQLRVHEEHRQEVLEEYKAFNNLNLQAEQL